MLSILMKFDVRDVMQNLYFANYFDVSVAFFGKKQEGRGTSVIVVVLLPRLFSTASLRFSLRFQGIEKFDLLKRLRVI